MNLDPTRSKGFISYVDDDIDGYDDDDDGGGGLFVTPSDYVNVKMLIWSHYIDNFVKIINLIDIVNVVLV